MNYTTSSLSNSIYLTDFDNTEVKPWPLAPDKCFVSKDGRGFYKKRNGSFGEYKIQCDWNNYHYICVNNPKNNNSHNVKIHRLVLESWVGPRPDKYHGAHLDGDKNNNNLSNLKWVTASENQKHKKLHGVPASSWARHENSHNSTKLERENIIDIRMSHQNGVSQAELARIYGVSETTIRQIYQNKIWKHIDASCAVYSEEDITGIKQHVKSEAAKEILEIIDKQLVIDGMANRKQVVDYISATFGIKEW